MLIGSKLREDGQARPEPAEHLRHPRRLRPVRGGPPHRRPGQLAGLVESTDVDRFRPVVDISDLGRDYLKSKGPNVPRSLRSGRPLRQGPLWRVAALDPSTRRRNRPGNRGEPVGCRDEGSRMRNPPIRTSRATRSTSSSRRCGCEWAREAGQSAFLIFTNKTLETLVTRAAPRSPHELASIKGSGRSSASATARPCWPRSRTRARAIGLASRPDRESRGRRGIRPIGFSKPGPASAKPESSNSLGQVLRPDRGVDLAAARSGVHARRGRGDPGSGTRGDRSPRDLDGEEGASHRDRALSFPLETLEAWDERRRRGEDGGAVGGRRSGGLWALIPGLSLGEFLIESFRKEDVTLKPRDERDRSPCHALHGNLGRQPGGRKRDRHARPGPLGLQRALPRRRPGRRRPLRLALRGRHHHPPDHRRRLGPRRRRSASSPTPCGP